MRFIPTTGCEMLDLTDNGREALEMLLEPDGYNSGYLKSRHWQRITLRTRELAFGLCEECGGLGSQSHHLTYATLGAEQPEDLIFVCGDCHVNLPTPPFPRRGTILKMLGHEARRPWSETPIAPKPTTILGAIGIAIVVALGILALPYLIVGIAIIFMAAVPIAFVVCLALDVWQAIRRKVGGR